MEKVDAGRQDKYSTPGHFYQGTQAAVEGLSGVTQGAVAYATDLNAIGTYYSGAWHWVAAGGGHDPVTLGTAHGLSLSTQVLSLAAAAHLQDGALLGTDWDDFDAKEDGANKTDDGTLGGGTPSHTLFPTEYAVRTYLAGMPGGGDMSKSTYDTDNDGVVDDSEKTRALYSTAIDSAIAPTDKQVLTWEAASSKWKAKDAGADPTLSVFGLLGWQ